MAITWGDAPDIGDREDTPPHVEQDAIAARAARWLEFMTWARQASLPIILDAVAKLLRGQTDPWYAHRGIDERLTAFADAEGWDGVLNALAATYREQRDQSPQEP